MIEELDDRGDEQRVLDQLREFLEGVEKKQNFKMMIETGLMVLLAVSLVTVLVLMWTWFLT